jgi:hypothetical protein
MLGASAADPADAAPRAGLLASTAWEATGQAAGETAEGGGSALRRPMT